MDNRFGTTEDMIIQPVEENGATYMLAIDKAGLYMTTATSFYLTYHWLNFYMQKIFLKHGNIHQCYWCR